MKDIVIRYMPKFMDRDFYRVYVPIREELFPFNFFDKGVAFKFAEDIIDGAFTEEEIENLFRTPLLPEKPKKARPVRPDTLPLGERSNGAWTAAKRVKVTFDTIHEKASKGVSSTDVFKAAKAQGDTCTQAAYLSLLHRLEKKGTLRMDGKARPTRFFLRAEGLPAAPQKPSEEAYND